ncbi:hypothetical protein MD484_g8905, partial [Candolleomyces efflorescens]
MDSSERRGWDRLFPDEVNSYQETWSITCACKRRFSNPTRYSKHILTCQDYKAKVRTEQAEKQSSFQDRANKRKGRGKSKLATWFGEGGNLDFDNQGSERASQSPGAGPSSGAGDKAPSGYDPQSTIHHLQEVESANPQPVHVELGRGRRQKRAPTRFKDFIPHGHIPLSSAIPDEDFVLPSSPSLQPEVPADNGPSQPSLVTKSTPKNSFGLYKKYQSKEDVPHDPDASTSPVDLEEEPAADLVDQLQQETPADFYPYPNSNSFKLGNWFWSDQNQKSTQSWKELVSIVGSPDFRSEDVQDTDWDKINRVLGSSEFEEKSSSDSPWYDDGTSWTKTPVTIRVPFNSRTAAKGPKEYTFPDFRHRPLLPLIKERIRNSGNDAFFHHVPHELRWKPGDDKEDVRVFNEIYQSDAFLQAYEDVQKLPGPEGCNLPRCVVGLMFASDATMLATFGSAKLWPLYMFFANDSKFQRGKPSMKLGEHVAYFEKLPDDFKDFYLKHSGKDTISQATLTHCQRELFHEQWKVVLDEEFLDAYEHGIVIECADGVKRRFYPRILTYAADYPEKILIASLKNLGKFPCPTCTIAMKDVPNMGTADDRDIRALGERIDDSDRRNRVDEARKLIYRPKRLNINSKAVNAELDHLSLVPTDNAFSLRLSRFNFNFYDMLSSDVLHEVELGVWKSVFIHLIRLLDALNPRGANDLDYRYRRVPTFGKDTIRRFRNNTSEMKQLAARDYEDILQCAIPVLEGLFPNQSHDDRVVELLFTMAHWHALAKLRMHTDHTLSILDALTTDLGSQLRQFVSTMCAEVETKELAREFDARTRREAKKQQKMAVVKGAKRQKISHPSDVETSGEPDSDKKPSGKQPKTLNLQTYKFHALGHVVRTIKRFGMTDNTSTQLSESYHRAPRAHYYRSNKKDVTLTFSRIQMRQARLKRLKQQLLPSNSEGKPPSPSEAHYFIGKSQNKPVDIPQFVYVHREDPVTWNFYTKLKVHLLPRVQQMLLEEARSAPENYGYALPLLERIASQEHGPPSDVEDESQRVFIVSDRAYKHEILQINYTTYDTRREQDILNPNTNRRDVMCLRPDFSPEAGSGSSSHPFAYARILGIFHVNVVFLGKGALDRRPRRFDVLWVRWYAELGDQQPWSACQLDRIKFPTISKGDNIGFLDPANVVRACHIIPRFSAGQVHSEGGRTAVSKLVKDNEDWKEYYVNRFVDRDMTMRYHWGLGVGHAYSHSDASTGTRPPEPEARNSPEGVHSVSDIPVSEAPEMDNSTIAEEATHTGNEVGAEASICTVGRSTLDSETPASFRSTGRERVVSTSTASTPIGGSQHAPDIAGTDPVLLRKEADDGEDVDDQAPESEEDTLHDREAEVIDELDGDRYELQNREIWALPEPDSESESEEVDESSWQAPSSLTL